MKIVKKILKILGWIIVSLLGLILIVGLYYYFKIQSDVTGKPLAAKESIERFYNEAYRSDSTTIANAELKYSSFDPVRFNSPDFKYGPLTRWWWPGNDVEKKELEREMSVFAKVGIAGVEIQPYSMGLKLKDIPQDQMDRIYSWDTPIFYENLRTVMDQALKEGMTVDLTNGAGWPTGGPYLSIDDNFKTLLFSEESVKGGKLIKWEIDKPKPPLSMYVTWLMRKVVDFFGISKLHNEKAELVGVVAAQIIKDDRSRWAYRITDQVELNPETMIILDNKVKDGKLKWEAPEGNWHIIAFWSAPSGGGPVVLPKEDPGYTLDHLDSLKVVGNYNYLLGERTGLQKYYGKPLRSVFSDSYEFTSDRHFYKGIFKYFKDTRGYDLEPWLPAVLKSGYNHTYAHMLLSKAKPDFVLTNEDWRIMYDYDLTLSESLLNQFFDVSTNWMSKRGIKFKTQAYGMPMDNIKAAGHADIPESEQLYGEGSVAFHKLVSSGAHLYNKPLVTCESLIYTDMPYMTTPLKLKVSVDKAFSSGVNQIIFHGSSYVYKKPEYEKDGWFSWSTPYATISFSADISERNNYWKFMPEINQYIRRVQYALQSGKPKADVLLYYPYLGIGYSRNLSNPKELLIGGHFKGLEPKIAGLEETAGAFIDIPEDSADILWLKKTYATIDALDAAGISWDWVNDESLQEATFDSGNVNIRGNSYKSIIISEAPFIQMKSAQNIEKLAQQGASVTFVGELPNKQPSFLNYEENDKITVNSIKGTIHASNGRQVTNVSALNSWINGLNVSLRYSKSNPYLSHIEKQMSDGTRVVFLNNTSNDWTDFKLNVSDEYKNAYWMNPENGEMYKAIPSDLNFRLPAYGSILLYLSPNQLPELTTQQIPATFMHSTVLQTLKSWNLKAGDVTINDTGLFDWRDNETLKFSSETGIYKTSFTMGTLEKDKKYLLNLGKVFSAAEILINGQKTTNALYFPYSVDISKYIKEGANTLEVQTTPTRRNGMIGEAAKGNKLFSQFEDKEDSLLPTGLLGPVTINNVKVELKEDDVIN